MFDDDLVAEVLSAINSQVMPQGWNDTMIVMIPKVQTPEKVSQFRPISLCNVVYKVISKMIATRLTLFLSDIISPTQSAFVPGRLITDNVLIAYESLHTIKQKKTGKEGWCAVKLDMHKAYDRVEWVFLEAILLKLGFHANWVNMVMLCVSSVEYRVRYTSTETEAFKPSRGLRQGDPLSPYLFLLCMEGLTALLSRAENNGDLMGVKVCRDAPAVSNLLFADDSLILMKANATNAACVNSIPDLYCSASGQLVSVEKSSIFSARAPMLMLRHMYAQLSRS